MNSLSRSIYSMAVIGLLSKIVGCIREIVVASYFGTSGEMDSFIVAGLIPLTLGLVIQGGIASTFIPLYQWYQACDRKQNAIDLTYASLLLVLISTLVLMFIGMAFSESIISILVPGFASEKQIITVRLSFIMLPCLVLSGILGLINALQQAHNMFTFTALGPLLYNVVFIWIISIFAPVYGIEVAAYGVILGVIAQLLIQWPGIIRCRPSFTMGAINLYPEIKKIASKILPVILCTSSTQLYVFVDRLLASFLPDGSISALTYGNRIIAVFTGLIAYPVYTALYPVLSLNYSSENIALYKIYLVKSIRVILIATVPIIALLIALHYQIVQVLMERGAFNSQATQATSLAVVYFAVGMIGISLTEVLNQAFFAQQNTLLPSVITILATLLNAVLSFVLIGPLAHGGLALATSISATIGSLALLILLKKRIGSLGGEALVIFFTKIITAGSIAGYFSRLTYGLVSHSFRYFDPFVERLIPLMVALVLGISAYSILCLMFRCEEALILLSRISKKIRELAGCTYLPLKGGRKWL